MTRISYRFSDRTHFMKASIIREILKISSRPGMTSFAGGLPAPDVFPIREFQIATRDALKLDGRKALQYTITEGLPSLKEYLSGWMRSKGIQCPPERMLLSHGSQQALDLLAKIFLNPGDSVLVEDPTYLGAIQSFNAYEPRYITVPIDEHGMIPDVLEKKLQKNKVKFIYTVPTFQNPAGITMTTERRRLLLKLAAKKNIPIIEDDPYGILRFHGKPAPSLFELSGGRGVIYLSTFSKLLSPGIRLGWILADHEVLRQLIFAKQAADLQTNTFIQYAVYHYCRRGFLEKHIPKIIKDYKKRAEVMIGSMRKYFPSEVQFIEPEGGMFVWCQLPKNIPASILFKKAIKKNVAFVDGSVFFAAGGGENTMRLNFTNSTCEAIESGIQRLGQVIKSLL